MDGAHRLQSCFQSGELVSPAAPGPTTVDLTRALFHLVGVPDLELTPEARDLRDTIGDADHHVFVIIDALGADLLERHSPDGFLADHRVGEIRAIFPSTTAAALTSFATGEYPAVHAVTGWWVHLVEHDVTVTALPFEERFSGRSLEGFGIEPAEVFRTSALLPRVPRSTLVITLDPFQHGAYVGYSSGGTPAAGYTEPAYAVERAVRHVESAGGPTYTSVYFPQVDEAGHVAGVDSEEIRARIRAMDELVQELADGLAGKARIVVTADHGQVALPRDRVVVLAEGDPLLQMLACPPAGEPVVPMFFTVDGDPDDFADAFEARFGDAFHLVTPDQAEGMGLFGPSPLSALTRARLGDVIGIASEPTALYYQPSGTRIEPHLGIHAGLTRGEMMVPLILL